MLDLSYFQSNSNVDIQLFRNAGTFSTWVKPRGTKVIEIICIGGGSGGGGGFQANTTTKTGGNGGSSGAITRAQFFASVIPDILYTFPGAGGAGGIGGASPTVGGSGLSSYVIFSPIAIKGTIDNVLITSGVSSSSSGGSAGISSGTPTTGIPESASTPSTACVFLNLGNFISTAGIVGGRGTSVTGEGITPTGIVTGGGGGGGTAGATGINETGPIPSLPSTIAGQRGADGIIIYDPILAFTGGIGGGGGTNGGNGGNGAYGCGGGGGGGGTTSAGNGGNGGDGLIIITSYR